MARIIAFSIILLFIHGVAAAQGKVIVSGKVASADNEPLPFANVFVLGADSSFVSGTITDEQGFFSISKLSTGKYILSINYIGYEDKKTEFIVGTLSNYLDLGQVALTPDRNSLEEVVVSGKEEDGISSAMDRKSYNLTDNISQGGGSVLQALKNLPGITVGQDDKVQLRGSDKVSVLIDGRQTAITGFGTQSGLDNIPASAIERIEIINNPTAKYDANGNAGIINIIYKKNRQQGFNGKLGMTAGLGALWQKRENYPGIRPQYQRTPKLNPSLSLNYRKQKINLFMQADWLYTQTLNKNDFIERVYDNGDVIKQQTKRNRNTSFTTAKAGMDYHLNSNNTFTVSGLFSSEMIIDRGDIPYFNADFSNRLRLWQFLEDEVKTTAMATALYSHKFRQPGHTLDAGFNYTFHREDEKYFFTNIMPTYTGYDSFKLISDENVADFNLDYVRPLRRGRIEAGAKFRYRFIPTDMNFLPGINSPLDTNAGGAATYYETIPAVYTNYVLESRRIEVEAGLRIEYADIYYEVNPNHNTYSSDGYNYIQPFPNMRFAYKLDERNKISLFFNRRVDRPNEVDIRIFPKYDNPEIIKVGNPGLQPQFTNSLELGYKTAWEHGDFYTAIYHRMTNGTITRIGTTVPGSTLIYNVFQNAGKSTNTGLEIVWQHNLEKWLSFNANATIYLNVIDSFTIINQYPQPSVYTAARQEFTSGNAKLNAMLHLPKNTELQLTGIYLASDVIPQGTIDPRYSIDFGAKKQIQKGRGELFFNASDIFNTMRISRRIQGDGFYYTSTDYYETQVFRIGYSYKL